MPVLTAALVSNAYCRACPGVRPRLYPSRATFKVIVDNIRQNKISVVRMGHLFAISSAEALVSRRQLLRSFVLAGCTFGPLATANLVFASDGKGWQASNDALSINVLEDGSFDLRLFGKTWMKSSPAAIHVSNAWYIAASGQSNSGGRLLKKVSSSSSSGEDKLGFFRSHRISWDADGTLFETSVRMYEKIPCLVFAQSFPKGAGNLKLPAKSVSNPPPPAPEGVNGPINDSGASTAYPVFHVPSLGEEFSYLSFHGCMVHQQRGKRLDKYVGGTQSGVPLISFNEQLHTVVLSPLNHFANAVQVKVKEFGDDLVCGLHGLVDNVPEGFSQEYIVYAGQGVNQTVYDWGTQLLKLGGKNRSAQDSDYTANYLGYWTDNGAFYYYNTEPGKNYETTMIDVAEHLKSERIPVGYLQLDSWWYKKGKDEGDALWEPRADVFPGGMKGLHIKTGLPFSTHNRYWSAENIYRDKYKFVCDKDGAVPDSIDFWMHIMSWARENGIIVYEQDWLNVAYERVKALETDVLLSERYLSQMNQAALACGINIMYCMPLPSHYLISTMNSAVTQIRASTDYCPGTDQWKMGENAMLCWALGLAPFKDVFWSTEVQEGSTYNNGKVTEPNFELQALVSALSRGAVGPGDKIGHMNRELLLKTCRADGLLLKPDKPATPLERCFMPDYPEGQIWDTYTKLGKNTWRYLLVAEQEAEFELSGQELNIQAPHLVYEMSVLQSDRSSPLPLPSSSSSSSSSRPGEHVQRRLMQVGEKLKVGASKSPRKGAVPVQYFVLAPVAEDGTAFIGTTDKFITVSPQRFENIENDGKKLMVLGISGEEVEFSWGFSKAPSGVKVDGRLLDSTAALKSSLFQQGIFRISIKLPESGRALVELA